MNKIMTGIMTKIMNGHLPCLAAVFALAMLLSGCAAGVTHTLFDSYGKSKPYTSAMLPVVWDDEPADKKEAVAVAGLFRKMSFEKMSLMNYRMQPLDETDRRLAGAANVDKLSKEELAALKTDSALRVRIVKWNSSSLATYSALSMKALFSLYSKDGELLWEAKYATKESDVKLDAKPMELAILKAYEPRVRRFIDMVLGTLPVAEEPSDNETFFQWLP